MQRQKLSRPEGVIDLGKIGDADLRLVPALAECNPGLEPTEYNLVIITPSMPERTTGGIILADETKDQRELAMQVGRIVRASPVAFNYEAWPDGHLPPQVGQLVWFARYAGGEFEGLDGRRYRIIKDKDVGAIIRDPAPEGGDDGATG